MLGGSAVFYFMKMHWRVITAGLAILLILLTVLGWHIGDITPGMSPSEIHARDQSRTISQIVNNPLYAPHKLIQYAAHKTGHHGPQAMRLASLLFAMLAVCTFFITLRWWFGTLLAALGTILFATSPWFIIAAHSATPNVLLLMPVTVFACFLWLEQTTKYQDIATVALTVAAAVGLYTPGVFWIMIIGAAVCWPTIRKLTGETSKWVPQACIILFVLLITPLLFSIVKDFDLLKQLLFIPTISGRSLSEIGQDIGWAGLTIVWHSRENLANSLGTQPMLNAASVVFGLVGLGWLAAQYRRRRSYFLLFAIIAGLILIGMLRDFTLLLILLPIIYILVTSGLAYLYQEWFKTFPRNPFARILAYSLICLVVLLSAVYGMRYSLVAWPRSAETKEVYMLQ